MSLLSALILGLIQGITEFLPVSSDGHLALARHWMGVMENGLAIDVALHFGTLLALLWFYRKMLVDLFTKQLFKPAPFQEHIAVCLLAGLIPVGITGFFFEISIGSLSRYPVWIALCFFVNGCILYSSKMTPSSPGKSLNFKIALWIGLAQVFSLLPGISRSGTTIVTGAHCGLSQKESADFSFLMAIPLLSAVTLLKCKAILNLPQAELLPLGLGILIAFVSGLIALQFLMGVLRGQKFHCFAWYCWTIVIVTFFVA
jgi:undecaprenyl-diphosphatase